MNPQESTWRESLQEISLADMLDARERRAGRQAQLFQAYPQLPLVCFTMNIAGPIKNSPLICRGFMEGRRQLLLQLMRFRKKPVYEALYQEPTGNEGYFVVDLPPASLKRLTTQLEDDTPLGRLFDMDVLDPRGKKLDRSELGLSERTCLLCEKSAKACARSRSHTVEQLQEKTRQILLHYFREKDLCFLSQNACRSLLYEVCTTPKPGLVDRNNNGSHQDMDLFSFLDSACTLAPYFRSCAQIGMDTQREEPRETFEQIRRAGMQAERDMLGITGGVNTHKGAIFSMGILCAALGRLPRKDWSDSQRVLSECAALAKGLTQRDFGSPAEKETETAGERIFRTYQIRGVRGQAEEGFPAVLKAGLPVLEEELKKGASINDAGRIAMLHILTAETDTNLISRGGRELQLSITRKVEELLQENPSPGEELLRELDETFIRLNLSPGGSADLLGLCYMLHFLKQEE